MVQKLRPSPLLKKLENHVAAIALYSMHFARIHKTLRVTPALAAGISDHDWPIETIVGLD